MSKHKDIIGLVREFYENHDQMTKIRSQESGVTPRDAEVITDYLEDLVCLADHIIGLTWPRDTVPALDKPRLTIEKQDQAVAIVAAWLGNRMGLDGPAPVGKEHAWRGAGPMLERDYEGLWYPQKPTPALILEGGPEDWAVWAAEECREQLLDIGVFAEPLASFILNLYPYTPPTPVTG